MVCVSSVSLNASSKTIKAGSSFTLSATVCPSNATNKSLTWSSSNSSVATVSGGVVCAKSKGTTTIKAAAQDGSGKSASCCVTVTEGVLATSVTVSPSSKTLKVTESTYLTATVCPANVSNSKVSWCSGTPSVASVNASSGLVNALKAGTATIYAVAADGSGKQGYATVTVTDVIKVSSITLNRSSISVEKGKSYTLSATVCPTNADNRSLTWSSSNTSVATVSGGVVCAKSKGTATIKATANDGSGKSASCSITVTENILVSSVTINRELYTLLEGKSGYLDVAVLPDNANNKTVSWCSSDPCVASVNATSGLIVANKVGSAMIYATANDGSGASDYCRVVVNPNVYISSICFVAPSNPWVVGVSKVKVSPIICPENVTDRRLIWRSSNDKVATVDDNGFVTTVGIGTATITAEAVKGNASASYKLTVVEDVPSNKDTREKVTINNELVATPKNGLVKYFTVKFPNGKVWKSIEIDLSYKAPDEYVSVTDTGLREVGRQRSNENYERYQDNKDMDYGFTQKELAFLYLLDPWGVEDYVALYVANHTSMSNEKIKFYKDDIFFGIFGRLPRLFLKKSDGMIDWQGESKRAVGQRGTVFSEAEILFGATHVWDWKLLAEKAWDLAIDLFTMLEKYSVIGNILTGRDLIKALYFSESVSDAVSGGVPTFLDGYLKEVAPKYSGMFGWIGFLLNRIQDGLEVLETPNLRELDIYDKLRSSVNYQTNFTTTKGSISIEEIVARYKT